MSTNLLKEAKELLKQNNTASLATATYEDASPEVSIIYYWYDRIRSLYFATLNDSLKIQNIVTNNKVALAIVNIDHKQELQIEGNAYIIENPDDRTTLLISIHKRIIKNTSIPAVWPIMELNPKDLTIVRVIIEKFKYSNITQKPPVLEGTFIDWI